MKLVGTAVVDGHEKSMAVVEVDGRRQPYFHEGDWVGNVLIKQILRDRIIVDAGNGDESLRLRQSLSTDAQGRPVSTQPPAAMQSFGPRPPKSRNLQIVRLNRSDKESLLGEVDQAMQEVHVDPVIIYGRPTGIRISPIEPGSIFSEIGLKQGEVIRDVEGEPLTGPKDAVALFNRIKKGGEFDITVKGRRTRRIHMIVD